MRSYYGSKVIVVTGGASGIGKALCSELAGYGAKVISADISNIDSAEEAENIRKVKLDVSDRDDFQRVIDNVVKDYGRLDMIFNCAGINVVVGEAYDLTLDQWKKMIDVNLWGVIHGTHMAYKYMVKQKSGQIVNISSLAGMLGYPLNLPYVATKSAIIEISNSLRAEGKAFGVKVNVTCPGYIQTNFIDSLNYIGADNKRMVDLLPFKPISVTKAAHIILKRVKKNQGIILFPFYAKLMWIIKRMSPLFLNPIFKKTVVEYREERANYSV